MTNPVLLAGLLASPEMMRVLELDGEMLTMPGRLSGGAGAGQGGDWPRLIPGAGEVTLRRAAASGRFDRYCEIMDLCPTLVDGAEIWGLGAGGGADWTPEEAPLSAAIAARLLHPDTDGRAETARLPRIADEVAAQLRAPGDPVATAHLPPPDPARVEVSDRQRRHAGFYALDALTLRHRRNDGGWSDEMTREVFISGDVALVLPYDPARDRVLLISQLRMGPLVRGQAQRWMLEPIAGHVDGAETPEAAAHRETREEAGLALRGLVALPGHYPTPGANCEFFYPFIGLADLPDTAAGAGGGLASEGEDIAAHVLPRAELMSLAAQGQLQCGPLLLMALWLDRNLDEIRARG